MRGGLVFCLCLCYGIVGATAMADESLYRYECDTLPVDTAGWIIANPCENECHELLENGHFVLFWPVPGDFANYSFEIARDPVPAPPTLWVEWRFRSNHPLGRIAFTCDGGFSVQYDGMGAVINTYGDAAVSMGAIGFVLGLDINEFHTYRFESLDGMNYNFSVDGEIFLVGFGNNPLGASLIQMKGNGGCGDDHILNQKHEWDYVRYGTISFGEKIIATAPPSGIVSPQAFPNLDRFVVTFDSPNYAYISDITVQVTGGIAPQVIKTRRREYDEPNTLEIVLDRPLPVDETTTFIFNDGQTTNKVVFAYGCADPTNTVDTDGDGLFDCLDDCPTDPNKTVPGQCGCGNPDVDTDGDGTADCVDGCPVDPNKTNPGQCGCGNADTDTDGDGVVNCLDGCPTDPNKIAPGQCGCGIADTDTDSDGTADCVDGCPTDPNKIAPGQCGCGQSDAVADSDGDGVLDCVDQCPGVNDTIDLNQNNVPDCTEAIPTVSHWGLVVLTLLLLVLAKCAPRFKHVADVRQ